MIVKIPRWNFDKFEGSDRTLGLQMKAVGEVMSMGRSFQEALHKATQSLEIKRNGLGADGKGYKDYDQIIEKLTYASWDRVFVIYDAIQLRIPLRTIHDITKIDLWFLKQYEELYTLEKEFQKNPFQVFRNSFRGQTKRIADRQIALMLDCLEVRFITSDLKWESKGYTNWWTLVLQSLKQNPLLLFLLLKNKCS